MRILVVEDEPVARARLVAHLVRRGVEVEAAACRAQTEEALSTFRPHLVLLDVLLPDCRDLSLARAIGSLEQIGLILITSMNARDQRLAGLRCGADDYLSKPVDIEELCLKIANLARRLGIASECSKRYSFGPWLFDPETLSLTASEAEVRARKLTASEARLLMLFLCRPGRVLGRAQILSAMDAIEGDLSARAVDSRIYRLRRKIETDTETPPLLRSVYGAGYVLDAPVQVLDDAALA